MFYNYQNLNIHYETSGNGQDIIFLHGWGSNSEIFKPIIKDIKNNHIVPFADYSFDCDKKNVVMNLVSEKYPDINWVYNKKGDFKKENFDACDSLVCSLAYSNLKRYGILNSEILTFEDWHDANVITSKVAAKNIFFILEKRFLTNYKYKHFLR